MPQFYENDRKADDMVISKELPRISGHITKSKFLVLIGRRIAYKAFLVMHSENSKKRGVLSPLYSSFPFLVTSNT